MVNLGQEERPRGHEGVQAPVVPHVGDDQGQEGRRRQGLREDELQQELGICTEPLNTQGCQVAKFDPFLSLDCARVERVRAQSEVRKGSNFAA